MITTGLTIVKAAFELLNVFQPSEQIPGPDAIAALGWLNRMVSGWAQQQNTIPSIARHVFPLVSGKGGPANPYTIGVGGDLNIPKPANQQAIVAVSCLLGASTPPVEIPRGYFTDDGWQSTQIKDLTNSLFTDLYYSPTFAAGLGTVQLWPVPLDVINSLVLYVQEALTQFVNLSAQYQIPDGYEDALVYNLARRIYKPWGATIDGDTIQMAKSTLGVVQRSNLRVSDLANDCVFENPLGWYNINTGQ